MRAAPLAPMALAGQAGVLILGIDAASGTGTYRKRRNVPSRIQWGLRGVEVAIRRESAACSAEALVGEELRPHQLLRAAEVCPETAHPDCRRSRPTGLGAGHRARPSSHADDGQAASRSRPPGAAAPGARRRCGRSRGEEADDFVGRLRIHQRADVEEYALPVRDEGVEAAVVYEHVCRFARASMPAAPRIGRAYVAAAATRSPRRGMIGIERACALRALDAGRRRGPRRGPRSKRRARRGRGATAGRREGGRKGRKALSSS